MRRALLFSLLVLTALSLVPLPAAAQKPKLLGSFKHWDALSYKEKGGRVCYMVSSPQDVAPKNVRRSDIYVMVSHRMGEKIRDEVSVIAGYPYKEKSEVEVTISGAKLQLFTEGESAWASEAKLDRALVRAMKRGSTMIVKGVSKRGTRTTDTYSLAGFTAAHDAIDLACKVK